MNSEKLETQLLAVLLVKKVQGNRIKICNFAQVVAYMCYLKMHKTIFSLCFSCHYNF